MDKQELRKLYKDKRNSLSPQQIEQFSDAICQQVIGLLNTGKAQIIHCFIPIAQHKEVNTWPIIEHCVKHQNEFSIASSVSNFNSHTLQHLLLNTTTKYSTNAYNITEPTNGDNIAPEQFTTVIIPLLCYDIKGNRIGYGKGFYDRFLKDCSPDVQKIGVSFFPPVDAVIESNSFDIPLSLLVTPEKVFTFNQ